MPSHLKELYHHRSIPELASSRILFAFGQALVSTAWAAIFINVKLNDSSISIIKFGASAIGVICALYLPYFLQKKDESKIYPLSLVISGLSLFLLAIFISKWAAITVFALSQVLNLARASSFSIMFRDSFERFKQYEMAQGILNSSICMAWFLGPILSGLIMQEQGLRLTVLYSGVAFILAAIVSSVKLKSHETKKIIASPNVLKNLKNAFTLKGFKRAYAIKSGIDAWWTIVFTFIPILMVHDGYSLSAVGAFIGLSQLPLVFAEFLTVRVLNRVTFRKVFMACYLALSLFIISVVLIGMNSFSLLLLVLASVPLAFLEPITEIYFYDLANKDQEELAYPIYLTSANFGEGAISLMILLLLSFWSLSLSLIAAAFYMFTIFLISLKVKE
jgi:MFS family permease